MSKTLQVMADRQPIKNALIAAAEVLNMSFQPGKSALSLRGGKLLHTLINNAGVDAPLDKEHAIPLAALNSFHLSKEELIDTCYELFGTSIRLEIVTPKGRKATKAGPLLAGIEHDYDDDGELRYELSSVLRRVMKNSNHWAVLSRQAVLAFQSRYSLRLYELISLRMGLNHKHRETFSIDELRNAFGVPKGKLKTWQDIKRYVIEKAIAEVNHLTGLAVHYEVIKRGRRITEVTFIWREKTAKERSITKRELDNSSVGRAARRDGTVEQMEAADRDEIAKELRALTNELGASISANNS